MFIHPLLPSLHPAQPPVYCIAIQYVYCIYITSLLGTTPSVLHQPQCIALQFTTPAMYILYIVKKHNNFAEVCCAEIAP